MWWGTSWSAIWRLWAGSGKICRPSRRAGCWSRPCAPPVHYIKQVSYVSGEPVSQEETYIPEALLPNLKQVDLGVFSVYEALEFYGIRVARREQSLEITELDPMDARLLNVEPGRGVLVLSSVSYDEEGRAVEFTRSYTRGDKCTFSVRYQREG